MPTRYSGRTRQLGGDRPMRLTSGRTARRLPESGFRQDHGIAPTTLRQTRPQRTARVRVTQDWIAPRRYHQAQQTHWRCRTARLLLLMRILECSRSCSDGLEFGVGQAFLVVADKLNVLCAKGPAIIVAYTQVGRVWNSPVRICAGITKKPTV